VSLRGDDKSSPELLTVGPALPYDNALYISPSDQGAVELHARAWGCEWHSVKLSHLRRRLTGLI
jgi:hypothetical protein